MSIATDLEGKPPVEVEGDSAEATEVGGLRWGVACLLLGLGALPAFGLSTDDVGSLAAALGLAGLGWVLALRCVFALESGAPGKRRSQGQRGDAAHGVGDVSLAFVLIVALALRGAALASDPELSDDVSRYVWEGALVAEGESPWAHAPAAAERAQQRERWPELYAALNNPDVSAAYPPVMQFFCAFVVQAAGGLDPPTGSRAQREVRVDRARFAMRLAFTCADLLLLVPLVSLLRRGGRPAALAITWAWCPLVVVAFAGTGHFDALGIFFLVAALAVRSVPGSALLLAAGTLVKFLPVLALPYLAVTWWREGDVKRTPRVLVGLGVFGLACALGMATPLLLTDGERGLLHGLTAYATRWESFHLCFRFLEGALVALFAPMDPGRVARLVIAALLVAFALWRFAGLLRAAGSRGPESGRGGLLAAVFAVLAALFVLTPTLHPWYLSWLVPFLALGIPRGWWLTSTRPAWLWLVAAAPLCYWPLERWRAEGIWYEPLWLWPLVALPFWALLLTGLAVRRRARQA